MLTFVIPTCQPKHLVYTLDSIRKYTKEAEIVVCENPEITQPVKDLCRKYNAIHVVSELGANNARNEGIACSKGDIICLTDDDCLFTKEWFDNFESVKNLLDENMVGGPLIPIFLSKRPEWLTQHFFPLLSEVDWQNEEILFNLREAIPSGYIVSANMLFSRKLFDKIGPFENLGYKGREEFISNDEIRIQRRTNVLYHQKLLVRHVIDASRMTVKYLVKRSYGQGVADAIYYLETGTAKEMYLYFTSELANRVMSDGELKFCKSLPSYIGEEWARNMIRIKLARILGIICHLEKTIDKIKPYSLLLAEQEAL